jgi:hypothetical protein
MFFPALSTINDSGDSRPNTPRLRRVLGFVALATSLAAAQREPTQPFVRAFSAGAFVDSIGVNVHFNYYGSVYTRQTGLVLERLKQLGISHLRDALCWQGRMPESHYYALHRRLGSLGYKTDYIASMDQPASQIATYPSLVNDMEAIEPANEYDVSGDPDWVARITAQQSEIYSIMRSVAPSVTVLAPSLAYPANAPRLGNVSHIADAGNLHGYFGGDNPAGTSNLIADMRQNTASEPTWVTESGYFAQPGPAFGSYGVTPGVQAIYSPRLLLDYWNSGAFRTYLYELADDLEPGETPAQYHWGLLDSNANPKPAFIALANLIQILADPAPPSDAAFSPAALPLTIQASSDSVRHSLFGKRDGTYYLALWNEVSSYNELTGQQLDPPRESVTIHIGRGVLYNGIRQFDSAGNYKTTPMPPNQTLVLPVTDQVQILTWVLR